MLQLNFVSHVKPLLRLHMKPGLKPPHTLVPPLNPFTVQHQKNSENPFKLNCHIGVTL